MFNIPDIASLKTQASTQLDKIANYPKGSPENSASSINDMKFMDVNKNEKAGVIYKTYPNDLLNALNNEYGETYVVFYINVQQDSKVKMDNTMGNIHDTMNVPTYGSRVTSEIKSSKVSDTSSVLSSAATLNPVAAASGAAGALAIASITTTNSRATRQLKAAIALYSPNTFSTNYGIDWSGAETASQQLMVDGVDAALKTMSSAVMNMVPGHGSDTAAEASKLKGIALGGVVSKALNEAPNKEMLSLRSGLASNSKKEMLFRGVDFRTFNFEYVFSPKDKKEYDDAMTIIKMFKFHMHPEYKVTEKTDTAGFVYLYPSEFDIIHYNANGENKNLPKHTSCALVNMTVNYTPNGQMNTFAGGAPTQINISLTFKELATLTKAEIAAGY